MADRLGKNESLSQVCLLACVVVLHTASHCW